MNKIKIYEFEMDWVAATNEREAVNFLIEEVGISEEELGECKELTNEDLEKLTFIDDWDDQGSSTRRSFKEQLEVEIKNGEHFPFLFASREM